MDKIVNSIELYYNYKFFDEIKIKSRIHPEKGKYYIINKNLMTEIKNNNEFKKIYELMEKYNIHENDDNKKKKFFRQLNIYQMMN